MFPLQYPVTSWCLPDIFTLTLKSGLGVSVEGILSLSHKLWVWGFRFFGFQAVEFKGSGLAVTEPRALTGILEVAESS